MFSGKIKIDLSDKKSNFNIKYKNAILKMCCNKFQLKSQNWIAYAYYDMCNTCNTSVTISIKYECIK